MAVRAVTAGAGIPLKPLPFPLPERPDDSGARERAEDARGAILELVGRVAGNDRPTILAEPQTTTPEEVRALRLLAVDNLVDNVHLREAIAERDTRIAELSRETAMWRQRAASETRARSAAVFAARRREEELFSELHLQILAVQTLNEELSWRRLPWWRRHRARRSLASAPR